MEIIQKFAVISKPDYSNALQHIETNESQIGNDNFCCLFWYVTSFDVVKQYRLLLTLELSYNVTTLVYKYVITKLCFCSFLWYVLYAMMWLWVIQTRIIDAQRDTELYADFNYDEIWCQSKIIFLLQHLATSLVRKLALCCFMWYAPHCEQFSCKECVWIWILAVSVGPIALKKSCKSETFVKIFNINLYSNTLLNWKALV